MRRTMSIRSKMLFCTLLPIALMGAAAVFTTYNAVNLASMFKLIFEKNNLLAELERDLDSAESRLQAYLSTKNSDSLKDYVHYSQLLEERSSSLARNIAADEAVLLERDTRSLVSRFLSVGETAIAAKRANRPAEYLRLSGEAEAIAAAVRYNVGLLGNLLLDRRLEVLSAYSARLVAIQRTDILLICILAALDLLLVVYFSMRITAPIMSLSSAAKLIAAGRLDGPDVKVESRDEIGVMTEVFNSMKSGIARYVDAIRDKAEMEASLMEQRVKNLEVTSLLRHAELSSLQARINPHFLFNTLNAGIQLATLEEADRTRIFLENLTAMLRYSIRELNAPATIADEFASIESYLYLIGIRFPGRIRAEIRLEPEAASASIPKMTIQPLVENAILHGFTDDVPKPLLTLEARREGGDILAIVEDNGVGFMPGRPEAIMAAAAAEDAAAWKPGPGEGESMGLVNVIRRLRLFTGREDALLIDDTKRIGSRIVIRIPEARRRGS